MRLPTPPISMHSSLVRLHIACAAALLLLAGCKSGPQATDDRAPTGQQERPDVASVVLYRYQFNPDQLTISKGTTVEFKNKDVEAHTVAIPSLEVEHEIAPGDTWSRTFDTRGEFELDNPNLSRPMTMTLIVE